MHQKLAMQWIQTGTGNRKKTIQIPFKQSRILCLVGPSELCALPQFHVVD